MANKFKNYTTDVPVQKTVLEIQGVLMDMKATRMGFDYDAQGNIAAVYFSIRTVGDRILDFKLPADVEAVARIMYGKTVKFTPAQLDQARKTAWRNVKLWIESQMAFIKTEQVKAEQLLMPFLLSADGKTTVYEQFENRGFLLPEKTS